MGTCRWRSCQNSCSVGSLGWASYPDRLSHLLCIYSSWRTRVQQSQPRQLDDVRRAYGSSCRYRWWRRCHCESLDLPSHCLDRLLTQLRDQSRCRWCESWTRRLSEYEPGFTRPALPRSYALELAGLTWSSLLALCYPWLHSRPCCRLCLEESS